MEQKTKENVYTSMYKAVGERENITNLRYPKEKENYEFNFCIGKVDIKFLLYAKKEMFKVTGIVNFPDLDDEELLDMGDKINGETKVARAVGYSNVLKVEKTIATKGKTDDVCKKDIEDAFIAYIDYVTDTLAPMVESRGAGDPDCFAEEGASQKEETKRDKTEEASSADVTKEAEDNTTEADSKEAEKPIAKEEPIAKAEPEKEDGDFFDAFVKENKFIEKKDAYSGKYKGNSITLKREKGGEITFKILCLGTLDATKKESATNISKNNGLGILVASKGYMLTQKMAISNNEELKNAINSFIETVEKTNKEISEVEETKEEPKPEAVSKEDTVKESKNEEVAKDNKSQKEEFKIETPVKEDASVKNKEVEKPSQESVKEQKQDSLDDITIDDIKPNNGDKKTKELYSEMERAFNEKKKQLEYKENTLKTKENVVNQRIKEINKERDEIKLAKEKASSDASIAEKLKTDNEELMSKNKGKEEELKAFETKLQLKELELSNSEKAINSKVETADNREKLLDEREKNVKEREAAMADLEKKVEQAEAEEQRLTLREKQIESEKETLEELKVNVEERLAFVQSLEDEKFSFESDTSEKDKEIESLNISLSEAKSQIAEFKSQVEVMESSVKDTESKLSKATADLEAKEKEIKDLNELLEMADSNDSDPVDTKEYEDKIASLEEELAKEKQQTKILKDENTKLKEAGEIAVSAVPEEKVKEYENKIKSLENTIKDMENTAKSVAIEEVLQKTFEDAGITLNLVNGDGNPIYTGEKDGCNINIMQDNHMLYITADSKKASKFNKKATELNNEDVTAMYGVSGKTMTCKKFYTNDVVGDVNAVIKNFKEFM